MPQGRTPRYHVDMVNLNTVVSDSVTETVNPVKVNLKTEPELKTAVAQVLSVDDTPYLRAQKLRAMADAAEAHAKLHDLGVMNNDFLLTNEPVFVPPSQSTEQVISTEPINGCFTHTPDGLQKTNRCTWKILIAIGATVTVTSLIFTGIYLFL